MWLFTKGRRVRALRPAVLLIISERKSKRRNLPESRTDNQIFLNLASNHAEFARFFNAFLIPKAKRRGVVETIFFGQKTAILFFKTVRRQNPEFEQGRGEDADGGSRVCRDANGVGLSCEIFQKGRLRRTPTRHSSASDAGRVKAVSRVLRTHHSSKGEGSTVGG